MDFIDNQNHCSKKRGSFGPLGNLAANGCGVIALYNVLCHFGCAADFEALAAKINRSWVLSVGLFGLLGLNPFYLLFTLKRHGFHTKVTRLTKKRLERFQIPRSSACIFLYFWKAKGKPGAHYQAAFAEEDGAIRSYNPNGTYRSAKDFVEKKKKTERLWAAFAITVRKD